MPPPLVLNRILNIRTWIGADVWTICFKLCLHGMAENSNEQAAI